MVLNPVQLSVEDDFAIALELALFISQHLGMFHHISFGQKEVETENCPKD